MAYELGADCDGGSYELLWAPWLMSSGAERRRGRLQAAMGDAVEHLLLGESHRNCEHQATPPMLQLVFKEATTGAAKSFNRRRQMLEPLSAIAKSYNRRHEKLQPKSQKASTMMTENYGDDGEAAAGR